MTPDTADEHVRELLEALDGAIELLQRFGEDHWVDRLRTARDRIAGEDANGLRLLLGSFGGMGSLNDLQLSGRARTGRRRRRRRRPTAVPVGPDVDDLLRGQLAVAHARASALLNDLERRGA